MQNVRQTHHLWTTEIVFQILHNQIYIGNLVMLKTKKVSYKTHKVIKRAENEQVVFYNTHEPIISQELWDKVKEMEASVSHGKVQKNKITLELSGLCYCADCGNKMYLGQTNPYLSKKTNTTKYNQNMNCGRYKRFGVKSCSSHFIKVKELNDIVLNNIKAKAKFVSEHEELARKQYLAMQNKKIDNTIIKNRKRLPIITSRITELDKLIQSTYEDKVLNKIPENI